MARQLTQDLDRRTGRSDRPRTARLAGLAVALAGGFLAVAPSPGFAGCVYPDEYMVRRLDMTVDYAATMDCIKSFEEETDKRIEEASEELQEDLAVIGTNTIRSRRGRRAYNMARLRSDETRSLIADLRATMARIHEQTRGLKQLAATASSSDDRKIEIISPAGTTIPKASENPRLQFIRPPDPEAPDTLVPADE